MGVMAYAVFSPENPDLFFESHAFVDASEQLEAIAKHLGLPGYFELFSYDLSDICSEKEIEEYIGEYQEPEIPWHDAQVGIEWLEAVSQHIRSNPKSVPNAEELLTDFS
ncbi:MAG: hypothetical protein FWD53_13160, partial [Phycisphaerales bacterium]|nr:hypothetical protein [Phycisphaerales bacterium]